MSDEEDYDENAEGNPEGEAAEAPPPPKPLDYDIISKGLSLIATTHPNVPCVPLDPKHPSLILIHYSSTMLHERPALVSITNHTI